MPRRTSEFRPHDIVEHALLLRDQPVACLAALVAGIRPKNPEDADRRIISLCHALTDEPSAANAFGALISGVVAGANTIPALTESGLDTDRGLYAEIARRVGRRLLPEVDDPNDLRSVIRTIFSSDRDYIWLGAISPHAWRRLLDVLGLGQAAQVGVPEAMISAIRVLAHHIASTGLSPEIVHRMPDLDDLTSPFLVLSEQALGATKDMAANAQMCAIKRAETLATLRQCSEAVAYLRANKHIFGTSLRLTRLSFYLSELVRRLQRFSAPSFDWWWTSPRLRIPGTMSSAPCGKAVTWWPSKSWNMQPRRAPSTSPKTARTTGVSCARACWEA